MSNKKIKLLMVPSDTSGVGHYRSIWPAQALSKHFSNDFEVEINLGPNVENLNYLKGFDIIHFHRHLGAPENQERVFNELKQAGVLLIMDLDDYWEPPTTHPMYSIAKSEKLTEKIISTLKIADYVTCTTDIFAKEITKYNKNVIVIPNAIDITDKMWSSEVLPAENDLCRIAWIGGSCYDEHTEILTENGFKFFKDLDKEEKVACLNPKTNYLEFKKPLGYIKEKYKGNINRGVNNLIDYAVTPNHKMYVSAVESLTQKKINFSLVASELVHGKNLHFKKDAAWVGQESALFTIPALKINEEELSAPFSLDMVGQKFSTNGSRNIVKKSKKNNLYLSNLSKVKKYYQDKKVDMNLWLKFFGFWIAEGWTSNTKGLHQVGISQVKNNGYLQEIFETLVAMGYNPTYTSDKKQIRVFDIQLWSYLNQFGKSYEKFIPKEILNLPPEQLNIFLDWFLKGDGSQEKGGIRLDKRITKQGLQRGLATFNSNRQRGYTVSKKLADNIQEICLKIGVISTITNRGIKNSTLKNRRVIRGKNPAFVISIGSNSKRSSKTPLLKSEQQFQEHYDGYVYCVTVPEHIIFVRRNGKTMWCGNSHEHDLKLLEPSMTRLHNNTELLNKFQMVMCGFDTRGTITMINQQTNEKNTRAILPHESIWCKFEEILTNKYSAIKNTDTDYFKWLSKIKREDYPEQYSKPYLRRWTLPLTQYGKHYDYCDVCLAPIVEIDRVKELRGGEIVSEHDERPGTIKTVPNYFNMVKCIVGDSLISTNLGFLKIKDIVENKTECFTEISNEKNKVINYFKYENVDTIKVTTKYGYEIEGTPHHRILINNEWKSLKELSIGNVLELTPPTFLQKKYQQMTFPMLLTKNITEEKIAKCDDSMLPKITVNEDWGRFLGYMLGGGNYGGSSIIRISCDKRHTDVVEDVTTLMRYIGLNPVCSEKKPDKRCESSLIKEGFGLDLVCTCVTFMKIAKKYNLCGSHGKTFRIPDLILQSPKSVITEFLKGLFEADGTVEDCGVSLCSKDIKLIQQVQFILLGLGITSKIRHSYNKHYKKDYYLLYLGRESTDIFAKEIGFVSAHKREKLKNIIAKPHSNALKNIVMQDEIEKIEYLKNDVYDIEVDSVHRYNANGIINHNSELKIIEAGVKKKVIIAQDFGVYKNLIKDGVNGLLISDNKDGWYKAIKKVILEPDFRQELANNLHEFVKEKYELKIVTAQRAQIYKELFEKNKKIDSVN